MNEQIDLYARSETRSATGEVAETWTKVETIWAEYKPRRGGEEAVAGSTDHRTEAVFRIHYRTDLDEKTLRIEFRSRTWNVFNIEQAPSRQFTELEAQSDAR